MSPWPAADSDYPKSMMQARGSRRLTGFQTVSTSAGGSACASSGELSALLRYAALGGRRWAVVALMLSTALRKGRTGDGIPPERSLRRRRAAVVWRQLGPALRAVPGSRLDPRAAADTGDRWCFCLVGSALPPSTHEERRSEDGVEEPRLVIVREPGRRRERSG